MDVIIPRRNKRRAGGSYTQFADASTFKAALETLSTGSVSNIEYFRGHTDPPGSWKQAVNVAASGMSPILCWAEANDVLWYSEKKLVYLPDDASGMFSWNGELRSLDLTGIRAAKTSNMSYLFAGNHFMWRLTLPTFNALNATNMRYMFNGCSSLQALDLSSFNAQNVENMESMFSDCSSLQALDLSSFNTSNATNMNRMFSSCTDLESLDLSSFDTRNVTNMYGMMEYCIILKTIYATSAFSTSRVTLSTNMFIDCTDLVGGAGTTYDSSHTDKEYARIDGGTSAPGYFTLKV